MQIGVLITNHGKHSDAKLAMACAGDIIKIDDSSSGQALIDGRNLETAIIAVLQGVFRKLADFEHASFDESGTEHLSSEMSAHPELFDEAVDGIMAEIAKSPLAAKFNNDDTKGLAVQKVEKWLCSGHHMHRDYFARWGKVGHEAELTAHSLHDPNCDHVKGWIAAQTAG